MIYEVRARMFFDKEDEAIDFYHDCELALPKATVVNPCQDNQECSGADLIRCRHDQHPNEPCDLNWRMTNCPVCD